MKRLYLLPWLVLGIAVLYLASGFMRPAHQSKFDVDAFAVLPVQNGGRIMPMDTLARTCLIILSGKQTFVDDHDMDHPVTRPAIEWLLDVMVSPPDEERLDGPAHKHKVFRIDNDQVLAFLGLKARPGLRYSFAEFSPRMLEIADEADRIDATEEKNRSLFENKLFELAQHIRLYKNITIWADPRVLPPLLPDDERWMNLYDAKLVMERIGRAVPGFQQYLGMLSAYGKGRAGEFEQSLVGYRDAVKQRAPEAFPKADFEVLFNRLEPFYKCMVFCVGIFILGCLYWMLGYGELRQAAFYLGLFTFLIQTWAIIGRIYLMGRPPVTNIYSSAIFIGWTAMGLGLVMEAIYRNGFAVVTASVTGFSSLFISHMLISGDTMEMLVAVLDTNFWLATHVVCVTFGYTATFVAGFLAMKFVLLGVFTRALQNDGIATLSKMIYGVICFATLLSFTGTVLGGIWADQSWGRFWGWDPKENGALLIVLWNALILHARWGGIVKQRGMAVLAVGGNIVTGWSWFGTNLLGIGLHSYGFMSGAMWALIGVDILMLGVIAIGALIPTKYWASYQPLRPSALQLPAKPKAAPRLKPA
ncbi:MAG: cytochrome c biogenesis protein CcsA [Planctomycetes bacterium]|nr:cytochrome c biogenesis protein CcsA [Planctomycetota bacterium]